MTDGLNTIIYPVKDLARAKAMFAGLLGAEPYADTAYYVGFKDAGQDVGLDPNGHAKGMTGPVPFWHVDDIDALRETGRYLVLTPEQCLEQAKAQGGMIDISPLTGGIAVDTAWQSLKLIESKVLPGLG